ncbi:MAG: polymerase subunit delta [Verrucomicrobiota bacterium]
MASPKTSTAAPLVLVHGDDDYAVKLRAKQLYTQWCTELGGMDHETIDAAVGNSDEALKALGKLREALQTLHFFGGGKAVWLRDCNFLGTDKTSSSKAVTEAIASLAEELKTFNWQGVRLLISATEVDKRRAFYKTFEKSGTVEAHVGWTLDQKGWMHEAEDWVLSKLEAQGKKITRDAMGELITRVGPNARSLATEVEKVSLYVGERAEITFNDVDAICTRNKQARAFALADALGDRNLPRLLKCLDEELWEIRLKIDKEKSEIGLLYGLISKVRVLILLNEMIREGWLKPNSSYDHIKNLANTIPAEKLPADKKYNPLAMHPYVLLNALKQVRNYSQAELVRAMDLLLQANRKLVSSSLDESMILQQTLAQIVGEPGRKPSA